MKSTVKKIGLFGIALIMAWSCQAIDYSLHMSDARVYRVGLGSGTAPTAADMKTIGIHPGDMVVNTDDDVLYIMSATNVYTKIDASGNMTLGFGITLNSTTITNVIGAGTVLPAVDYSAATNGAAGNIASGNLAVARITNALTTAGASLGGNVPVAAITNAAGTLGTSIGGNIPIAALTNASGAAGLVVVTNLDANGTTNICTFLGTVSYP